MSFVADVSDLPAERRRGRPASPPSTSAAIVKDEAPERPNEGSPTPFLPGERPAGGGERQIEGGGLPGVLAEGEQDVRETGVSIVGPIERPLPDRPPAGKLTPSQLGERRPATVTFTPVSGRRPPGPKDVGKPGKTWKRHSPGRRTGQGRDRSLTRGPGALRLLAASVLLCVTFVLGVVNAFVSDPMAAQVETPEDIFSEGRGTLSGKVIDMETGEGLPDVTMDLLGTGHTTKTDDDGWYFIHELEDGDYTLVASLDGYGELHRKITFSSSYPHTEDMELMEDGGVVREDHRDPLRQEPYRDAGHLRLLMGVLTVPALVAAVLALRREMFWLAVTGAFLGAFSLGFGVGAFCSLLALALILSAKELFGPPVAVTPEGGERKGDEPGAFVKY
jgi:hypothetical protein